MIKMLIGKLGSAFGFKLGQQSELQCKAQMSKMKCQNPKNVKKGKGNCCKKKPVCRDPCAEDKDARAIAAHIAGISNNEDSTELSEQFIKKHIGGKQDR